MTGSGTLQFSREGFEPAGLAVGVQFPVYFFRKPVQRPAGGAVFVFGVIFRINFDGPEGDDLAVNHHADVLAVQRALEPGAQVLPGGGDRKSFHKDILMPF